LLNQTDFNVFDTVANCREAKCRCIMGEDDNRSAARAALRLLCQGRELQQRAISPLKQ